MDFFAPISVYRAAYDNRGQVMPLAEFMKLGKEQYAAQIQAYRERKAKLAELMDYRTILEETVADLTDEIEEKRNPLGGEDTPEVAELRKQVSEAKDGIEQVSAEIKTLDEELKKRKQAFPCATLSGYFAPTRAIANLKQHSGFICIDIDDHYFIEKKKYYQSLTGVMDVLRQHPNVCYASRSVGGVGYFALIPLGPVDEKHTHAWYFDCLKADFEELGIVIDPACRDITRNRFVSMDDAPLRNPQAVPYLGRSDFESRNELNRQRQEAQRQARMNELHHQALLRDPDLDRRHMARCVERLLMERPSGFFNKYEECTRVTTAVAVQFGEEGRQFFHDMCSIYSGYKYESYDKMYNSFLRTAAHQTTITQPMRVIMSYFKKFNITFKEDNR